MEFFSDLLKADFMPHGHCYFWRPEIIWSMVISNGFIALAYFTIPFSIFYFISKRTDLVFNWVYVLFAFFIIFCGLTHVFDIITIWKPFYRTDAVIRMITAGLSLSTGIYLIKLMPSAITMPTIRQMESVNANLDEANKELRKKEGILKELTDELIEAQEIGHLGSWTFFPDNDQIIWSAETYRIHGIPVGSKISTPILRERIHPEDFSIASGALKAALTGGDEYNCQYRIIDGYGQVKHVHSRGRVMFDLNGKPVKLKGTTQDITDLKLNEKALQNSNEKLQSTIRELERSNRELEHYAYIASHDLQEPLRTISSYIQLLDMKYKDKLDEQGHEFIAYVLEGTKRMRSLVKDLLDISKVNREGQKEKVNVKNVLKELKLELKEAISTANADIIIPEELPLISAVPVHIKQIFHNLLSNSLKFRNSVAVRIEVGFEELPDRWKFSVKDNGIGFDQKYAEKIFVVFQRLHNRETYPGTGIGLAICKKIIDLNQGEIWVESEPGKGSTFYFTLPKS